MPRPDVAINGNDDAKTTTTYAARSLTSGSAGKPRLYRPSPESVPPENALNAPLDNVVAMPE